MYLGLLYSNNTYSKAALRKKVYRCYGQAIKINRVVYAFLWSCLVLFIVFSLVRAVFWWLFYKWLYNGSDILSDCLRRVMLYHVMSVCLRGRLTLVGSDNCITLTWQIYTVNLGVKITTHKNKLICWVDIDAHFCPSNTLFTLFINLFLTFCLDNIYLI